MISMKCHLNKQRNTHRDHQKQKQKEIFSNIFTYNIHFLFFTFIQMHVTYNDLFVLKHKEMPFKLSIEVIKMIKEIDRHRQNVAPSLYTIVSNSTK